MHSVYASTHSVTSIKEDVVVVVVVAVVVVPVSNVGKRRIAAVVGFTANDTRLSLRPVAPDAERFTIAAQDG